MSNQHARQVSRRRFLGGLTLLGTTGFLGLCPRSIAAEPPPETTKIRLGHSTAICIAPLYVAAELLPGEGFTEVQYIRIGQELFVQAMAAGEIDIALNFSGPLLPHLEAGDPLVILAGAHVGCFELFGADHIRAIRDLKGKTVAVTQLGGPDHVFLTSILTYVGVNPREDIHWVIHPFAESMPFLLVTWSIGRGGASKTRQLILLISVGWLPPDLPPSGACLGLGTRVSCSRFTPSRIAPHRGCASSDRQGKPAALLVQWRSVGWTYRVTGTCLAMAHMNPTSSRAIATTTWLACFPRASSRRKRLHNRTCAFQLMS